jgi:NADP-dependent 3-hydroxy acid dehydrogenase YdfG
MTQVLVVVVTGSSAGLERAIAHRSARRGARIRPIARNLEALETNRERRESLGGPALVLPLSRSLRVVVESGFAKHSLPLSRTEAHRG